MPEDPTRANEPVEPVEPIAAVFCEQALRLRRMSMEVIANAELVEPWL